MTAQEMFDKLGYWLAISQYIEVKPTYFRYVKDVPPSTMYIIDFYIDEKEVKVLYGDGKERSAIDEELKAINKQWEELGVSNDRRRD